MTPSEWKDWVIGGRQALLDQQENMIFMAQANGLVQGGKSLKRLQRHIDHARYAVRDDEEEYQRQRQRKLAQNRRNREAQKRGTHKFMDSLRKTSQKGG